MLPWLGTHEPAMPTVPWVGVGETVTRRLQALTLMERQATMTTAVTMTIVSGRTLTLPSERMNCTSNPFGV